MTEGGQGCGRWWEGGGQVSDGGRGGQVCDRRWERGDQVCGGEKDMFVADDDKGRDSRCLVEVDREGSDGGRQGGQVCGEGTREASC